MQREAALRYERMPECIGKEEKVKVARKWMGFGDLDFAPNVMKRQEIPRVRPFLCFINDVCALALVCTYTHTHILRSRSKMF